MFLFAYILFQTLDFISQVLSKPNWPEFVPSLQIDFPELSIGGWKEGHEFLRIDGTIKGSERGNLINRFNDLDSTKVFLISMLAGGIGINLCSANRVSVRCKLCDLTFLINFF